MEYARTLRELASTYRAQADTNADPDVRAELLKLAEICDEVAGTLEDRVAGG